MLPRSLIAGLSLLTAAFLPLRISALAADASVPPEIENEQILGINKEPAHATLMPYASLQEALAAKRHASSFCRSLNGLWKFNWVQRPEQRPVDFYKPEYDVSAWKEIPVPSCWQLLGYGTPYYRNNGYIFQKDWPRVMTEPPKEFTSYIERNPVGSYRREFEVPATWAGRRIRLQFDGVDSAFFLWINGQKIGFSVNSRNAAEFDITQYLKPGKNIVAAEVYRFSAGCYIEDQDMWRLSGIFRNVTLWSAPEVHLRDFYAKPDLDAQYRDGSVEVIAKIRNYGDKQAPARTLSVAVFDRAGTPVSTAKCEAAVPALAAGEEQTVTLKAIVTNPAKWTAETPNLYTTVLTLGDAAGASEILSCRTGFRKIEIKGRLFLVNGVPIKLKGANRHENWPDTGHYVSEERMIRDLEVLKQGNCNHVRTCHYSDDPRWYELCDEYGIYLTAEANCECHGYYNVLDREPRYEKAIVDRSVANVENFKNHASVIIWSLGNECGGGSNLAAALKAVKALNTDRPVHYEAFGIGEHNPADIDSRMYTSSGDVEAIAKDPKYTKPFYLCEYAHAMFNSMGSIGEYNDAFDKYPALLGGAIWEWEDQGIWNRRDPKHPILAYGGGFGEVPNDHYFIHKGVVFSDRSPKPHYPEMKHVYQWIGIEAGDGAPGTVVIRNRYQFIDLTGFPATWTLSEDGREIEAGSLGVLDIAAGASKTVAIPFHAPPTLKPGAEYFLRLSFKLGKDQLWAKAGYEIAAAQLQLPLKQEAPVASVAAMKPVKLEQDDARITVTGDGFSVVFDKGTGRIAQIERNGTGILVPGFGPELHLWRAPHRTDDMWAYNDWEKAGLPEMKWTVAAVRAEQSQKHAHAAVIYTSSVGKGSGLFSVTHSAVYTVYGDGSIAVDNAVVPMGRRIPLARLGVRMVLDKRMDRFTYLGRGPMENYADRKRGFDVGLYSSSVREQMTPYAKPMECGNHEDVRWAAVTGSGLPGLLAQPGDGGLMQASVLPYTDEQMTPVEYTIDLPESPGTVLTLGARTLGAGSNGCGPRPLDKYIVWSDPATFSYNLRVLPAGATEIPGRLAAPRDRVKPVLGKRNRRTGEVSLTCDTPEARIEYSKDGGSWRPYAGPFSDTQTDSLSVRATHASAQAYRGVVSLASIDRRIDWKIVSASSFQAGEGDPAHVLDGDPGTYWHTRWKPDEAKYPHHLVIDFGGPTKVGTVVYQARGGESGENGRVRNYEIYFSNDGKTWGTPAAKGHFQSRTGEQLAKLPKPLVARYMKFVALSEVRGNNFASVAELDVLP